jgi:3-phosphoshikimate 1-carboxyvinyltransferase
MWPFVMTHPSNASAPRPLIARASKKLTGTIRVPGDKSISHRSLMFGAIALGRTHVTGLLEGEDVLNTAAAMRAMGATIEQLADGRWVIDGVGIGGLAEPDHVIDLGNSGTSARLLMGLVATHPHTVFFTGDASLRRRPMARVIEPLQRMGAQFVSRSGGKFPLAVVGTDLPMPIDYRLPVASAQVKSAILLAGLNTPGETTVIEPIPTRDHTENMLRHFGADLRLGTTDDGATVATMIGQPILRAADIIVPSDPSSAAFPIVAALLCPDSDLIITGVGLNERRTGLFTTLIEMGGDITLENQRIEGGEPVGDLRIRHSKLKAIDVPPGRAASMIDEYPVLAMAAACADGVTRMNGIHELRVKESDRLAAVARGLMACGVKIEEGDDFLIVHGNGKPPAGGAKIETSLDHRIAMCFLVLGLVTSSPIQIDDGRPIDTSFPTFLPLMQSIGAMVEPATS